MENAIKLSDQLKDLMIDKGLNALQLSKEIKVGKSSIARYLHGTQLPKFEIMVAIVEYFDCSTDFLLGLTDYPKRTGQAFKPVPSFAMQFRVALQKSGVSQYALQKRTKISWSLINAWIRGTSLPSVDSLVKMASALECSVDFLIGRED